MARTLRALIILALIGALALVGAIFVFWIPSFHSYVLSLEGDFPVLSSLIYPISALVALLCVAALAIALAFPSAMKHDKVFSNATASKISVISLLIAISGTLILLCSIFLIYIGDTLVSFPLMTVAAIILLIAFMLSVLATYVRRATVIKAASDATL